MNSMQKSYGNVVIALPADQTIQVRCRPSLFFKGSSLASFCLFSSFQIDITFFTTKICEEMSIQYTVLGFEPKT